MSDQSAAANLRAELERTNVELAAIREGLNNTIPRQEYQARQRRVASSLILFFVLGVAVASAVVRSEANRIEGCKARNSQARTIQEVLVDARNRQSSPEARARYDHYITRFEPVSCGGLRWMLNATLTLFGVVVIVGLPLKVIAYRRRRDE